jgi:flagellar protein FliS
MNPYASYQQTSIANIPREDLLLKLFEGALLRIKQAREEWASGSAKRARDLRTQVVNIVTELDSTLDRENGDPSLVEELDSLYGYMIRELNACTREDNFDRLNSIQTVLENLYDGFESAAKAYKKQYSNAAFNPGLTTTQAAKPGLQLKS